MKIEKNVLNNALRVLGKVVCQTSPVREFRCVRFVSIDGDVWAEATDGMEKVSLRILRDVHDKVDFVVEYRALRELVRTAKSSEVEVEGEKIKYPSVEAVPADAMVTDLPVNFCELLNWAAPIVNRNEPRAQLRGINLSADGVTVTDGRQLLNLPCPLTLRDSVTIPFPFALLAAKLREPGKLASWTSKANRLFRMEIGDFVWYGKCPQGTYPEWQRVIPDNRYLNYSITFHAPLQVLEFLNAVPDHAPNHGVELNVTPNGVTIVPIDTPNMQFETAADHSGVRPRAVLALNKHILKRMLAQGYRKIRASADGLNAVVSEGGLGRYVAMPIHITPKKIENSIQQPKEEKKEMENMSNHAVGTVYPAPVVSPLDELNANIEALRNQLKTMLDESGTLIRKVKEVTLQHKQKEREYLTAKRTLERIRTASGF